MPSHCDCHHTPGPCSGPCKGPKVVKVQMLNKEHEVSESEMEVLLNVLRQLRKKTRRPRSRT